MSTADLLLPSVRFLRSYVCLRLILVKMLARLFLRRLLLEESYFVAFDRQIRAGQQRPQCSGQHLIPLQFIKGLVERGGKATDAALLTLLVAVVAGVDLLRFTRIDLVLDAIQPGSDERAQRQVRIAAMVGALEFEIDRTGLAPAKERWHANRALAIIEAIRIICRTPIVRQQAAI